VTSFKKYLRISKNRDDKELHLKKLSAVLCTPHWREVLEEIEDTLLKTYEEFDTCTNIEGFLSIQGEVVALKKIANLNGLLKIVAQRRQRIRPTE
jgi:hypothetical protein